MYICSIYLYIYMCFGIMREYVSIWMCVCVCVCVVIVMGSLTEKLTFSVLSSHHETTLKFFMRPKSFSLVLSLLSDYIQGNTVDKKFQILIKLNFINIYTIVRG